VCQHVLVVLVVQDVGGLEVLHHRVVGAVGRRAGSLQRGGERRVHVGGVAGRQAVPAEGGAVGAADAVRAGERDHVDVVQPLGGEHLDEQVEAGERRGKVRQGLAGEGHVAVVAAGGHGEVDAAAAEEVGRVAGGERDDVRARDDAGACRLDLRLGRVDHLVPA